jgi:HEAT repeat protein
MRKTHDKKQPQTTAAHNPRHHVSFEWPLLIYPVLFLTTLAILYAVNRSIEKESPTPLKEQRTTQESAVTSDRLADDTTGNHAKLASGLSPHSRQSAGAPTSQDSRAASNASRPSSVAGRMQHAVDLSRLKGAARTAALLRIAVDEKDHARIKQYLAELVAMGDEAVIPLSSLLGDEEGDAALWAATALARIGTPAAAGALLDRLSQTKDGAYKEDLSKRVSSIGNHDSWPLLLDTMIQASDSTVVRAAGTALSAMADAPVIDEVMVRYDSASTEAEVDRLAQLVRNIRSPKATESLLSLAGSVSSASADSLQEAAIEALAKVGDAQSISYLLQRLEASPPGQDTQLFNTITRIDSPEAETSLLYAAAGNKEVSAEHGQTAAIYALKNYPDEKTVALLERIIAQEQNEKVLTAATRTLDDIKRSPRTVTANADSLQKSEEMLPLKLLEK